MLSGKSFLPLKIYILANMKRSHLTIMVVLLGLATIASSLMIIIFYVHPMMYRNRHLDIMRNCHDPSKKVIVRSWFLSTYNFTEIYDWVHETLVFVPFNESFPEEQRNTDPIEIREFGRGRSEEFSVLYVASCLAQGYECRLVVATEFNLLSWTNHHAWTEIQVSGDWVHVDPSERRWNEPHMYQEWSWGEDIGSKVKIFAFEESKVEEVTQNYS